MLVSRMSGLELLTAGNAGCRHRPRHRGLKIALGLFGGQWAGQNLVLGHELQDVPPGDPEQLRGAPLAYLRLA